MHMRAKVVNCTETDQTDTLNKLHLPTAQLKKVTKLGKYDGVGVYYIPILETRLHK